MGKILLVALWIVTLYLTVVLAVTLVLLIAPVKMTQEETYILAGFLGAGNLALLIVAVCALFRELPREDERNSVEPQ